MAIGAQPRPPFRLQTQRAAQALLEDFDRGAEQWRTPKAGRLWDATHVALHLGRTGAGASIAVIDGPIDPTIGLLADVDRVRVAPASTDEPTAHGTAVVLLVRTVAPEAKITVYETNLFGRPDKASVIAALEQVADSDATVVVLSLGIQRQVGFVVQWGQAFVDDDCDLCTAAGRVARSGKIVVAAAGNAAGCITCPARDSSILACGFQIDHRMQAPDGFEYSDPQSPGDQSKWVNFTLNQETHAVGTSFAAPLLAGFIALMDNPSEVNALVYSAAAASWAAYLHRTAMEGAPGIYGHALAAFAGALASHPHQHPDPRSGVPAGAHPCPECTLFSEDLYVNYAACLLQGAASAQLAGEGPELRSRAEGLLFLASVRTPLSGPAASLLAKMRFDQAMAELQGDGATPHVVQLLEASCRYWGKARRLMPDSEQLQRRAEESELLLRRLRAAVDAIAEVNELLSCGMPETAHVAHRMMSLCAALGPAIVSDEFRVTMCELLTHLHGASHPARAQLDERWDIEAFIAVWRHRDGHAE